MKDKVQKSKRFTQISIVMSQGLHPDELWWQESKFFLQAEGLIIFPTNEKILSMLETWRETKSRGNKIKGNNIAKEVSWRAEPEPNGRMWLQFSNSVCEKAKCASYLDLGRYAEGGGWQTKNAISGAPPTRKDSSSDSAQRADASLWINIFSFYVHVFILKQNGFPSSCGIC